LNPQIVDRKSPVPPGSPASAKVIHKPSRHDVDNGTLLAILLTTSIAGGETVPMMRETPATGPVLSGVRPIPEAWPCR
jgi:hypothetical protein